jgi:hypothetical protein
VLCSYRRSFKTENIEEMQEKGVDQEVVIKTAAFFSR